MSIRDIFKKKTVVSETITTTTTTTETVVSNNNEKEKQTETYKDFAPKNVGKLDMVIAFDTTGSMAQYIGDVRTQVSELIPELFKDNEDLRLGIVAFGDYCDMTDAQNFGNAYQNIPLTNNENELVKFVMESSNTGGGDGDEFYELVIKKIVEESRWRPDSTRVILLISDANPHPLGYTYSDYVVNNTIDWRKEAQKAADQKIKIDTVTIHDLPWQRELSAMTNGVSVPFYSSYKTTELLRASVSARGSLKSREKFDKFLMECEDSEMKEVFKSYKKSRDSFD